jgi:1-deoxy-D-xylulose-5-phosphate synthase
MGKMRNAVSLPTVHTNMKDSAAQGSAPIDWKGFDLLPKINSPAGLRRLSHEELRRLATEIRAYLTACLARTGGHLAPSLGVVELTLALQLPGIRQYGGISGFLRIDESECDIYGAGHASTAISAALGFAKARDFRGSPESVVALVGDGALTGGLALEGLNNAAHADTDICIVLNDNEMSIAQNVGAIATYLSRLRMSPTYQRAELSVKGVIEGLPIYSDLAMKAARAAKNAATHWATPAHKGLLFEEMGLTYIGPVDGHNIEALLDVFAHVKRLKGPVLVHVLTVKGKGLPYAEADSRTYHGVTQFSPDDGRMEKKVVGPTFTSAFTDALLTAAAGDDAIIGITAAMPDGTGLAKFAKAYPDRTFDVGIAEQHAVVFAAGLAASGFKPVCAIYSTFLQRAYDPIIHDVALQNLPVRFFLDRGGLVGDDGGTHHGVFDLSYLRCIPNLVIMAPKDVEEMGAMTRFALDYELGPIAVRYPRGGIEALRPQSPRIELGKAEIMESAGTAALIVAIGAGVELALNASRLLKAKNIEVTVINARFVKPLDAGAICAAARRCAMVVTVEDNVVSGGFGTAVLELLAANGIMKPVKLFGLPDHFVEHGPVPVLRELVGLTAVAIASHVAGVPEEVFDPARTSALASPPSGATVA